MQSLARNVGQQDKNRKDWRLLMGPLAACIFGVGVIVLARTIPGYSQIRQTVSEIGEVGSPARWLFTLMLCTVAVCLLIFSAAIRCIGTANRTIKMACLFCCIHGNTRRRDRHICVSARSSQPFRDTGNCWLPGSACNGSHVETPS